MSEANSLPISECQEIDSKMESEDEFRLQWNDHKNTLVTVFETLLESGTLVDCSLAAEGQFLKAHKVVLSACSPYFELLFSEHKEKHPILILKDVKFQELRALMDYMYRGEVNIPQDRLEALLDTAESLQIKGLGGCKTGVENSKPSQKRDVADIQKTSSRIRHSSHLTNDSVGCAQVSSPVGTSRTGSVSPTPRKRMRHILPPVSGNKEDTSLSSVSSIPIVSIESLDQRREIPSQTNQPSRPPPLPVPPIADVSIIPSSSVPTTAAPSSVTNSVTSSKGDWTSRESESSSSPRQGNVTLSTNHQLNVKTEPPVEIMLQPKTEYIEEIGDDDITQNSVVLDDSDYAEPRSGPSHAEDGSSNQGTSFAPWLSVAEWAVDEMPPQQSVGSYRDTQDALTEVENLLGSSSNGNRSLDYDRGMRPIISASVNASPPSPSRPRQSYVSLRSGGGGPGSRRLPFTQPPPATVRAGGRGATGGPSDSSKAHACSLCGATFAEGFSLRRHARVHTGERPFRCEACGRAFADGSNCNKHRACVHGLAPRGRRGGM